MAPTELMQESFRRLAARDLDGCQELMAPDFAMNLAGLDEPLVGREVWRGNTEYLLSAFPDVELTVEEMLPSLGDDGEDRVTCRMSFAGSHTGEFLGIAPTGRRATWASYEIYRVREGLVAEEWILTDLYSLTQQLGARPGRAGG